MLMLKLVPKSLKKNFFENYLNKEIDYHRINRIKKMVVLKMVLKKY